MWQRVPLMTELAFAPSVAAACERWADRPAVTHAGRTLTYAQLWTQIRTVAATWRALGVRPGDRIVCQMPTSLEHVVLPAAAWECGAVHVGVHRDTAPAELAEVVRDVQASVLVFQPPAAAAAGSDPLAGVRAARSAWPSVRVVVHGATHEPGDIALTDILNDPPPLRDRQVARPPDAPDDVDLLLLTSGATGRPKAVMETLPALLAKVGLFADALRATPDDVHLLYLPLNHAFGLKLALTSLLSGGRLVCLERFSPDRALDLIAAERVTVTSGSPTHFALLLRVLDAGRHDLTALRWAVSAAATLPPALAAEMYERFGCDIFSVYGSSEGFLTVTSDPDDIRAGSVGTHVFRGPEGSPPDGRVAVLPPRWARALAPGEVGEIAYGAATPVRYWDTSRAGTDGWYRTGDLGRVDSQGRLFVCGRLKEVVNRGGLKVACAEVETLLSDHPSVAECAIVPVPDEVLGEAICACVVALPDAAAPTLDGLRSFLGARLSRQKLPDELSVMTALPRTPLGKLDRQALIAAVANPDLQRERLSREPAPAAANRE